MTTDYGGGLIFPDSWAYGPPDPPERPECPYCGGTGMVEFDTGLPSDPQAVECPACSPTETSEPLSEHREHVRHDASLPPICEACGAPVIVYDALVDRMVAHDCRPKECDCPPDPSGDHTEDCRQNGAMADPVTLHLTPLQAHVLEEILYAADEPMARELLQELAEQERGS